MSFLRDRTFYHVLDTVGDGTGSIDGDGNFSGSPTPFIYAPKNNEIALVTRLDILIEDSRVDREERYGDISGGVSNGLLIQWTNGTDTIDINPIPLRRNRDFLTVGQPLWNPWLRGDEDATRWRVLHIRIDLPRLTGFGVRLEAFNNERLQVVLNDNFSGLDEHRFSIAGLLDI